MPFSRRTEYEDVIVTLRCLGVVLGMGVLMRLEAIRM